MKSKRKVKKKKNMFGGLNKLPPEVIEKIANWHGTGAKITGTAKLGLNNRNKREVISKKKNFKNLNNLSKKTQQAYYAAINQDRHGMAFNFLKKKKTIDKEINNLKKKMSWKAHKPNRTLDPNFYNNDDEYSEWV